MRIAKITFFFLLFPLFMFAQKAERLGSAVNSQFEEREPMPTHDGKYLYIWRRQHPQNTNGYNDQGDIWVAKIGPNDEFQPARRLNAPLNSRGIDFVWATSPNHDTLFVSQIMVQGQRGFMYTTLGSRGYWNNQRSFTIEDYTPLGEYKDYSFTAEGHVLLPNKGTDTEGGPDIYVYFKKGETTWGNPKNLGPDINTRFHEDAPHMMADGETLYFNRGIGRSGPHDVYVTKRLDDTWQRWSTPEPVGPPINTPGYEADFIISPDEKWAYWIADINQSGNIDIYRMPLNRCEVDVYAEGEMRMCEGDSLKLEAGFNTLGNVRYQWYHEGRAIAGANTKVHMAKKAGSYQVERQSPGCLVKSDPIRIQSKSSPEVTVSPDAVFLCDQDQVTLQATTKGGNRWHWMRNGLKMPDEFSPTLTVNRPGLYSVMVSNGECASRSNFVQVGRMEKPVVFPHNMKEGSSRPTPYEWLWTAGFGAKKNWLLQDMAADPLGRTVVLGLKKNGSSHEEVLLAFGREGQSRLQKNFGPADERAKRFVAVDYEGNIILANRERMLRKYNANGSLQWQINQSVEDLSGLTVDPLGHVYVYGRFQRDIKIGRKRFKANARGSAYLAKYDPRGKQLWVKTFSTEASGIDHGNALGCDNEGNIYLSGDFEAIANFAPGHVLHAGFSSNFYFLAKYNPAGEVLWCTKLATRKTGPRSSDFFVDERGQSYALHGERYFKVNKEGEIIQKMNLKAPGNRAPRMARIIVDGQGTLFTYALTDKKKYFLNRTDRNGRSLTVWQQKSSSKEDENLPVLATNEEGKLFVAGLSKSKPPSKQDIGDQTGFITTFGLPDPELKTAPLALCPGQSLMLQVRIPLAIPFYWMKDGKPIPGANDTLLLVRESGEYQVKAFSNGCERHSNIQLVGDCNQKIASKPKPAPRIEPTPEPVEEPVVQNQPELVKEEVAVDEAPKKRDSKPEKRNISNQGKVTVSNPKIKIYVWDHGSMDNDTISVIVNDKVVLKEYCLTRRPKVIKVKLDPNQNNRVELYAHNLGAIPPNTASIRVDDGKHSQTLELKSNLRKSGSFNIRVK